ncbi:uncharacterized protein LOC129605488 [Condylostylus longicornis]|uniref:uncharacterized protein LOC129605488 n=1 Tax=Condylostylus longicornis TaxID=2530218 RepID=UPI00244DF0D5|nr:uncharacterized protein LOC129605488 [Condylostylus longicornis]
MLDLRTLVVYLAIVTLLWQIPITNSRTSTLWKLNENGKITGYADEGKDVLLSHTMEKKLKEDDIFNIITSTVVTYGNSWSKQSIEKNCDGLICDIDEKLQKKEEPVKNSSINSNKQSNDSVDATVDSTTTILTKNNNKRESSGDLLDCGKPVNFTYYDYLIGVANRFSHPLTPEPDVAYLFMKNPDERSLRSFDINLLEKRLKRAKKEKPRSVNLYNQIGNYWRIKGDPRLSIECFRRALAITPTNAEVLLNLAGVLFNLQYLDDAIHLTRRSLEVQPPDRSAWRQYLTLGEIFKAYGHFQESMLHLRHALELSSPLQHEPILKVLREVESLPSSPLHAYTVIIILALVIAVFIVIITSTDSESTNSQSEFEPKRHFNRAMAMRSLKGFSSRHFKHRKY